MNCKVFYHDKCFDGACSAALFTRVHRECVGTAAEFGYQGLVHRAGQLFDSAEFTGDENAIVDFKYFASPLVTWWFDHHLSAFAGAEEQAAFEASPEAGVRQFYDAGYTSCTKLIADVAEAKFGFDAWPVAELVHWADIVDGAKYESAAAAVGMVEPAMRLTLVIESSADATLTGRLIPLLTEMPLAAVLEQPFVAEQLGPLLAGHQAAVEWIRARATLERGVVTFDITDQPTEGYNKFIPYFLYPAATYTVGLSRSSFRVKISVGTNPWTELPASKLVNLAAVCERYGGGGHARVGAISFPPGDEAGARVAVEEIVRELREA